MKQLFLIIIVLLFSTFAFSQDTAPAVEIFFITAGAPTSPIISCTMTAQSQCWDISYPPPSQPGNYFLSDDYDNVIYVPTGNNLGGLSAGFDFVTARGGAPGTGYPEFAFGIYKVTSNVTSKYFYLDYRDCRAGYYNEPVYGHPIDIWIKYIYNQDKFYYSSDPSSIGYSEISTGQRLNIWDIKQKGQPSTSLFPLYLTVSSQNSHPYLQWNVYNDSNILGYNIYRKITLGAGGNQTNVIFTTSTSFLDVNFEIGPPKIPGNDQVEYWIKAKISSTEESLEGNHVQVVGTSIIQWKMSDKESNDDLYYKLKQNYPNPFNPLTIIEYSIAENSFVTIKVYDMLGNELAVLVNENKEPGSYKTTFKASNFPSGIYFYQLQAGDFISTKKLILLK